MEHTVRRTTLSLKYIVDPTQIGYISSILEGFDGCGVVRTIDRAKGIIVIWSAPDFFKLTLDVMNSLKKYFYIQPVKKFVEVTGNEEFTF